MLYRVEAAGGVGAEKVDQRFYGPVVLDFRPVGLRKLPAEIFGQALALSRNFLVAQIIAEPLGGECRRRVLDRPLRAPIMGATGFPVSAQIAGSVSSPHCRSPLFNPGRNCPWATSSIGLHFHRYLIDRQGRC